MILGPVRLDKIFNCSSDGKAPWESLVVTVEYDGKQHFLALEIFGGEYIVGIKKKLILVRKLLLDFKQSKHRIITSSNLFNKIPPVFKIYQTAI